jgi:hypothetical protein
VVKLLPADPRVNPAIGENRPTIQACEEGHAVVVKLMLADPRVDPSACFNLLLQVAACGGHDAVVRTDPRVIR